MLTELVDYLASGGHWHAVSVTQHLLNELALIEDKREREERERLEHERLDQSNPAERK